MSIIGILVEGYSFYRLKALIAIELLIIFLSFINFIILKVLIASIPFFCEYFFKLLSPVASIQLLFLLK